MDVARYLNVVRWWLLTVGASDALVEAEDRIDGQLTAPAPGLGDDEPDGDDDPVWGADAEMDAFARAQATIAEET